MGYIRWLAAARGAAAPEEGPGGGGISTASAAGLGTRTGRPLARSAVAPRCFLEELRGIS